MTETPLRRLMGLETEYAVCTGDSANDVQRVGPETQRDAFHAILESLRQRLPCADADVTHSGKSGVFMATGGAVWFESLFPSLNVGLVEGATPECRGVKQLIACQRAQDQLLTEAADTCGVKLLKNDCDGNDQPYGAQENFEVTLDSGWRLKAYRIAAIATLPILIMISQLILIPLLLAFLATVPITACIFFALMVNGRYKTPRKFREGFDYWIGRVWREGWNGSDIPFGGWTARLILVGILICVAPLAAMVWLLIWPTRLGRMHRELAPFLASRVVFAGAGRIDKKGDFHLSDKAFSKRAVMGMPEYMQGFFSLGQFVKPCLTVIRFREVLNERQRIQIAIGDSNLCEEAEYLRVGTTALLIDAIEAGFLKDRVRILRPVAALHRFDRDPTLVATAKVKGIGRLTAIELQRHYWGVCREYVSSVQGSLLNNETVDDSTARSSIEEAEDILERWKNVLDALESNPDTLIGRVDWVTKRFLLRQTAPHPSWAVTKKIDLKYHQLGEEGYYSQFTKTEFFVPVIDRNEIERATRLPPPDSPAIRRSNLIREYSAIGSPISWTT